MVDPMQLICDIYRSSRDSDMYLYVSKAEGTSRVPGELLAKFGKPQHAMTLLLQPQRKLARADVLQVMEQIREKGFYLQLPPTRDPEMQAIHRSNSKISL